jgi:hypothetical protein
MGGGHDAAALRQVRFILRCFTAPLPSADRSIVAIRAFSVLFDFGSMPLCFESSTL